MKIPNLSPPFLSIFQATYLWDKLGHLTRVWLCPHASLTFFSQTPMSFDPSLGLKLAMTTFKGGCHQNKRDQIVKFCIQLMFVFFEFYAVVSLNLYNTSNEKYIIWLVCKHEWISSQGLLLGYLCFETSQICICMAKHITETIIPVQTMERPFGRGQNNPIFGGRSNDHHGYFHHVSFLWDDPPSRTTLSFSESGY